MNKKYKEELRKELLADAEFMKDRAHQVLEGLVIEYSYRDLAKVLDCHKDSICNWVRGHYRMSKDKAKTVLEFVKEI